MLRQLVDFGVIKLETETDVRLDDRDGGHRVAGKTLG